MDRLFCKSHWVCALAVVVSLCMIGCNNLLRLKNANTGGAPTETQALGKKLGLYIECMNQYDDQLHHTYNEYTKQIDQAKGPSKGHVVSGMYANNDYYVKLCTEKLQEGIKSSPQIADLDASAQNYLNAITKLAPLMKQADDYYKQEDYKDDNFAKGQELHRPLIAAFDDFNKTSKQLREAVDQQDLLFKERELSELEKTGGRKLRYLSRMMMLRAKELVQLGTATPIDAAKFQPALDAYSKSIDEADQYYAGHNNEVQTACWSDLTRSAREFLKEAKDKGRALREGKQPAPQRGIFGDRFIDAYNNLISSSNTCLNFI